MIKWLLFRDVSKQTVDTNLDCGSVNIYKFLSTISKKLFIFMYLFYYFIFFCISFWNSDSCQKISFPAFNEPLKMCDKLNAKKTLRRYAFYILCFVICKIQYYEVMEVIFIFFWLWFNLLYTGYIKRVSQVKQVSNHPYFTIKLKAYVDDYIKQRAMLKEALGWLWIFSRQINQI